MQAMAPQSFQGHSGMNPLAARLAQVFAGQQGGMSTMGAAPIGAMSTMDAAPAGVMPGMSTMGAAAPGAIPGMSMIEAAPAINTMGAAPPRRFGGGRFGRIPQMANHSMINRR